MRPSNDERARVGVVGLGTIGLDVARRLAGGAVPGARLFGVSSRDAETTRERAATIDTTPPVLGLEELIAGSDIVVESASAAAFAGIARRVLEAGKVLVPVSVSALARVEGLDRVAADNNGRIVIPGGGMIGLDAIRAAAEDGIERALVRMTITPDSLRNEDYVMSNGIRVDEAIGEPKPVFRGTVREAARALPNHCNNPVALALASIGMDRTEVEVFALAGLPGARVEVEVDAAAATLRFSSQNLPSFASPRTSRIIAPSVVAAIRSLVEPVRVGS